MEETKKKAVTTSEGLCHLSTTREIPKMEAKIQSSTTIHAREEGEDPIKRRRQAMSMAVEWPEGEVFKTWALESKSGLGVRCFQRVEETPATTAKQNICKARPNFLRAMVQANPPRPSTQIREIMNPSVVKRFGRKAR